MLLISVTAWSLPGISGVGYLIVSCTVLLAQLPGREGVTAREDIGTASTAFPHVLGLGAQVERDFCALGSRMKYKSFQHFATRNHANVFANPLAVLLAVLERSPPWEVVILTSNFCSLSCPKWSTLFSPGVGGRDTLST